MSVELYTIHQIIEALEKSWSPESRYQEIAWDSGNPARGQCAVSSLVVQDYLGGDLKRFSVIVEGKEEKHFVNLLPNGEIIDATRSQYAEDISMVDSLPNLEGFKSIREKLMSDEDTHKRYKILGARVAKQLAILNVAKDN